jgi:hypothetical protein
MTYGCGVRVDFDVAFVEVFIGSSFLAGEF